MICVKTSRVNVAEVCDARHAILRVGKWIRCPGFRERQSSLFLLTIPKRLLPCQLCALLLCNLGTKGRMHSVEGWLSHCVGFHKTVSTLPASRIYCLTDSSSNCVSLLPGEGPGRRKDGTADLNPGCHCSLQGWESLCVPTGQLKAAFGEEMGSQELTAGARTCNSRALLMAAPIGHEMRVSGSCHG
jgi:hypothetical protein